MVFCTYSPSSFNLNIMMSFASDGSLQWKFNILHSNGAKISNSAIRKNCVIGTWNSIIADVRNKTSCYKKSINNGVM